MALESMNETVFFVAMGDDDRYAVSPDRCDVEAFAALHHVFIHKVSAETACLAIEEMLERHAEFEAATREFDGGEWSSSARDFKGHVFGQRKKR